MLSILVCHSYYLQLDQKQLERGKPYPPLATLQVAAMLRQAGHRVAFFDAMLADGVGEYQRTLRTLAPQVVLVYEDTFNYLSKMCLSSMRRAACDMIAAAHRAGARVIAAGPDVSDAPGPYLHAGADLTLIGEGLLALFELLPRLDTHPGAQWRELIEGLSGVAALSEGAINIVHGARALPISRYRGFAAWDFVDIERYRAVWKKQHGYFSLNMAGSRGCSFRCAWCAKPTWGHQYLQRSPGDVALEMIYLKRTFGADHIWFADDIFGFRVDWVNEFAAAVRSAGNVIPFTIQTRADLISERMAQALGNAGCQEAWIGAESGSQRMLDAMNKGTTVSQVRTARTRLKTAGIRVGFFIQLGYLGENLADILATRELLVAARPDEIGVSVAYPLPGTKFHQLVEEQLGRKTHWQDSNDLAMMFQGTYTTNFYRTVRNLLHDQISLQAMAVEADPLGAAGLEHFRAMSALERRWTQLKDDEIQFRSPNAQAAAQG